MKSNNRMIDYKETGWDLEGSGPAVIEVLYCNLPGRFREVTNPAVKMVGVPAGIRI
jgi:hypothetical protein